MKLSSKTLSAVVAGLFCCLPSKEVKGGVPSGELINNEVPVACMEIINGVVEEKVEYILSSAKKDILKASEEGSFPEIPSKDIEEGVGKFGIVEEEVLGKVEGISKMLRRIMEEGGLGSGSGEVCSDLQKLVYTNLAGVIEKETGFSVRIIDEKPLGN